MSAPAAARFRPAVEADLEACCRIWKAGIDDYQGRLNQPPMPEDTSSLHRLLAHFLATDPDRFWVAERGGGSGPPEPVAFGSAHVRGDLWFLAMLFVDPTLQASGLGRTLLERTFAGAHPAPADGGPAGGVSRWATCTDAAQPISNALYASYGLVPRLPIWRIAGEVHRPTELPVLPAHVRAVPFEAVADGTAGGHRRLADLVDAVDVEVLGYPRGADHAYLRREERRGVLYLESADRAVGYGYASASGRLGPVAALEPDLVPAVLGHLATTIPAGGISAAWVPGAAGSAFAGLLRAGMRLEGFPGLLCWTDGPMPFERYVPISLALL